MKIKLKRMALAAASVGLLTIYGCGGGGGVEATTSVPITVIDGAIENATVCLDKNNNGVCDAGEPTGKTSKTGTVNLTVDNADLGKYPVLAVVGTDAIDVDTGTVPVAFTMSTPADKPGVVSPLTTMVHQTSVSNSITTAQATQLVQETTGIKASLFEDFTKVSAPTDGSVSAAVVARMVVVTTQEQSKIIKDKENTQAEDGVVITKAMLDTAIRVKLLELLPSLITAMNDPAVLAAADGKAREAVLLTSATKLVTDSGMTASSIATVVAINTQALSTAAVTTVAPSSGFSISELTFKDASNYFVRIMGSTLAQATPDAEGSWKYVERRKRSDAGVVATWGAGKEPARNADLHWNGTAWANCPINFENTSGLVDAKGNNTYNYCGGRETGKGNRALFDVSGKTMASVMTSIRNAGYTNVVLGDNTDATLTTLLGSTTFPAASTLRYQTTTPLTNAIAYYPGSNNPVGYSNVATQYSAAVSAGGTFSPANTVGCNSTEYKSTNGANSTTFEKLITSMTGTPCTAASPGSFSYNSVTYTSPDSVDESWGNSTLSLATLGTAPVGSGIAPGFYTTNTRLRLAFKGSGDKAVTYYACKEKFTNGSSRNCKVIGTGSYTIATLGDARVMTLSNPPAQTSELSYTKVLVERNGVIYHGYQPKQNISKTARFSTTAANALAQQLGITLEDVATPLALTKASYQGTWDVFSSTNLIEPRRVAIKSNGAVECKNSAATVTYVCSLDSFNPITGAFTLTMADTSPNPTTNVAGIINFDTGAFTGKNTADNSTQTFSGQRR